MKIAIATSGRFHVLDLARELHALGHEVIFYSYVPVERAVKFGLPADCQKCLLPYVFPLMALRRVAPKFLQPHVNRWILKVMDQLIAWKLEACDVFIGMSGLCVASASQARRKYGAKVLIERGSTHILRQKEIMATFRGEDQVSDFDVQRELASYEQADLIVLASLTGEESFIERGIAREKLFRNPYGVDLNMFPPTPAPESLDPTVLFVGGWIYRKGCDLWAEILNRMPDLRLIHVGNPGDAPFPDSPRFTHVGTVNQWELQNYYAKAHVFALASREEGFGLVLSQALACGLPVVCSDQTGGRDLSAIVGDPNLVRVFPVDNVEALCEALKASLAFALGRKGPRTLPEKVREQLSWRSYGERYSQKLLEITNGKNAK